MNENRLTLKITFCALFTALAVIIPSLFHLTGINGRIFLPMHIPVFLCGIVCGISFGIMCSILSVTICAVFTGAPPLYPTAIAMIFELMTYASIIGILSHLKRPKLYKMIILMFVAMLVGRFVGGAINALLMGIAGMPYSFKIFLTANFVTAWIGIVIQLVVLPIFYVFFMEGKFKYIRATRKPRENIEQNSI